MRKKMSYKLTEEQKKEIIKLIIEEGYSPTDVAKKFNVSRITVYNIVKKFKKDMKVLKII